MSISGWLAAVQQLLAMGGGDPVTDIYSPAHLVIVNQTITRILVPSNPTTIQVPATMTSIEVPVQGGY